MDASIYLDHAATTPLSPEARAAMEPFLSENYANPSSIYRMAQSARSTLDAARTTVADCLGARATEVVFTSGGTESNNAAILGTMLPLGQDPGHVVTTAIEHHAVLHPIEELADWSGVRNTLVPVPVNGIVEPDDVLRALRPDTRLVSVMWANNEIGTIQPIAEISSMLRSRDVIFHVDAVQAAGILPIDLTEVPVDLLSISAHKFYGPKGVAALVVRGGTRWRPLLTGGTQERNRRAGTENVAAIVGMARALECACEEREGNATRVRALRDSLLASIQRRVGGVHVNGDMESRLPGNLNLSFDGVHGESLLVALDLAGIMASSGSACTSGSLEPSHVLEAIGVPDDRIRSSLRLTLGRENTFAEIEHASTVIAAVVERLRALSPAARIA